MKHSAQSLRHFPEPSDPPPRAVKMDLAKLIAPYRGRGPFTLRVENLPQAARLSAGQNNGDRTWSLLLHELEGLTYYPPQSAQPQHMLALRLIAKDDTEADTIALIDFLAGEAALLGAELPGVLSAPPSVLGAPVDHRAEIAALKAEMAGRETELAAMRAAVTRVEKHWRQTLDEKMAEAEIIWSKQEALRATVLRTGLEEEFGLKLAALARRAESDDAALSGHGLALEEAQRALMAAQEAMKEAGGAAKAEQLRLQTQLEDLRQHSDAEIAAIKAKAARHLKNAENAWLAQTEKKLAELMARLETAENTARPKDRARESESEIAELKTALAHQRLLAETALAAAPARNQADDAYVRGLEREIKTLRATLADREAALARGHAMEAAMPRPRPAQPSIRWRAARQDNGEAPDRAPDRANAKLLRDAVLVILAVILAVLFAPRIGVPADLGGILQSWLDRGAAPPPAPPPVAAKPAPAPAISVARAVKLRAGPSLNAAVAANLKAGVNVAIIERRGNWAHVRILEPNAAVKDGWVYGSYLTQ